jgi:hypothetical protein
MKPLAICCIVRDEAAYIAEWVAFHRLVGVSRWFVYDDRSEDDTLAILGRMDRGDLTIHAYQEGWHSEPYYAPGDIALPWRDRPQCCAYNHCARHHAGDFWCAYLDVDEFLFHTAVDSLPEFLEQFESNPGVVANWLVFGSSGHSTRPPGLTIEAYTRRGHVGQPNPWGRHVKTIVNMSHQHTWGPHGSHTPVFAEWQVDQHGRPNPWSMTDHPSDSGLLVNHYYHRSAAEAAFKATRDDRNAPAGWKQSAVRIAAHDLNDVTDHEILRFLPALKTELGIA